MRKYLIFLCLTALLVTVPGCGTLGSSSPTITAVEKIATPQQAKKALAMIQAIRVSVRDAVADAYVKQRPGATARLVTDVDAADKMVTFYWDLAANAADAWAGTSTPAYPVGLDPRTTFSGTYDQLIKALSSMQSTASTGGVQ
jgi:hypothetical protein